jgi:hypothetical protein
MSPHHLDGRMSIHAVEGRLGVTLPAEVVEVSAGELIVHDHAIPRQVEVLEESAFLLTISWPGGTKEERYARKDVVS